MGAFRSTANAASDCIQSCTASAHLCLETLAWCQATGGRYAEPGHLALLALCADTCSASARAIIGGSDAHVFLCHACAQVCQRCAQACRALGDEQPLGACASACENTARSCADMVNFPVPALERKAS
jgi:hypothetical protein